MTKSRDKFWRSVLSNFISADCVIFDFLSCVCLPPGFWFHFLTVDGLLCRGKYNGCCHIYQRQSEGGPDMCHLLRLVPGPSHVVLHASLLQAVHLQVLERDTGACNLPTVQKGVQLQGCSYQLPGCSLGGEGQGHHLRHSHPEPEGGCTAFIKCHIISLLAALHVFSYRSARNFY